MVGFRKVLVYIIGILAIVLPSIFGKPLDGYAIGGITTLALCAMGANVVSKWVNKEGNSWESNSTPTEPQP